MIKMKNIFAFRFLLFPIILARRKFRVWLFHHRLASFRMHLTRVSSSLSKAVFVKVGANDGITGDPCSDILLSCNSWTGLLIEPVPYCVDRLKENFSDQTRFSIEQAAISGAPGTVLFYHVDRDAIIHVPSLPVWYDQLGSFDRTHILKHLGSKIEPFIIESEIQTCTLSGAFQKNSINEIQCHPIALISRLWPLSFPRI